MEHLVGMGATTAAQQWEQSALADGGEGQCSIHGDTRHVSDSDGAPSCEPTTAQEDSSLPPSCPSPSIGSVSLHTLTSSPPFPGHRKLGDAAGATLPPRHIGSRRMGCISAWTAGWLLPTQSAIHSTACLGAYHMPDTVTSAHTAFKTGAYNHQQP